MFDNVIVKKPWGKEFALLTNDEIAIWHLFIDANQGTSLHSHPLKKTGLVVLSGVAEVSFMNGKHRLLSGEKIMIRNGVFHSTKAIRGKLQLIEVECPNNKADLIRLQDDYGRSGQPYEGSDHYEPNYFKPDFVKGEIIGDCMLKSFEISSAEELIGRPESKIVITSGKITYNDYTILGIGDIVDHVTLSRLAKKFTCHPMKIIEITNVV